MDNLGTIMVVDDFPANLEMLVTLLTHHGYDTRPAISGAMALQAVHSDPPDLILLDINMPEMNGFEVCTALKADPRTQHIPVIFISALDETLDKVKAFNVGGVDYLTKPIQTEETLARIQTQMTLAHQRQQLEQHYQELEHLRQQERLRFEELNALKDQFVRTVSHDLKNPIGIILGHIEMLEDSPTLHDSDRELLQNIRVGAERINHLIRDLLDLARIEAGMSLRLESGSLGNFLHSCLAGVEVLAQKSNLTLHYQAPVPDLRVSLDEQRINQVLQNLLSNAIKYTPSGGHIYLSTQDLGNHYEMVVEDTGLGIPAADIPHIFERFYRVHRLDYRKIEGTGLGLSITKAIVEQHGGQIIVESAEGKGSRFTVRLPKQPFRRTVSLAN
jgi:signal transduction histidine kinase